MALYRDGKASLAANGTVTGTNTKWQSSLSLIRPGATIMFLSSPMQMAVVNKVVSDTEIKAITTNGAVVPSSDYAILLSDSLTVDGLAQDVAETLRYYQSQETIIAEAIEFFKEFDFEALKTLADQVKADAESSATNAAAAAASQEAAKTSESNSKASETAANASKTDAQTAKNQTQELYNQTADLVAGVQAPDKLTLSNGSERVWMKIANIKNAGQSYCFVQFIIGGGSGYGTANVPVDIFSLSGRNLPSTLTSDNIDIWFTQRVLVNSRPGSQRINLGVVKNTNGSCDVYLHAPAGYIPNLWLNRVNVQANNGLITGPIIDRTGYSWITTEPTGIVYNSPVGYIASNDNTVARTNVANTFSHPQAISVPGGNATLTLNGAIIRANNNNAIVYSIPSGAQGMYFRTDGDTNDTKQVSFNATQFTIAGLNAIFGKDLTVTGSSKFSNVSASGSLSVTGESTMSSAKLSGSLSVTGDSTLKNISATGTLSVAGKTTLTGDVDSKGIVSFAQAFTISSAAKAGCRSELGLGSAATMNTGTEGNVVPILGSGINTFSGGYVKRTGGPTEYGAYGFVAESVGDPNAPSGTNRTGGRFVSRLNGTSVEAFFSSQENLGNYCQVNFELNAYGSRKTWNFREDGNIYTPVGMVAIAGSDIRLKTEVLESKKGAMDRIMKIGAVEFRMLSKDYRQRGFIAQQLNTIDPIYTFYGGDTEDVNGERFEILNVDHMAIIADLVSTVQSLKDEIEELKSK